MKIIRGHSSYLQFCSFLGAFFIALTLAACGGSDKKAEPVPKPGAPSVSVSATGPKTLTFSWSEVNYATSYRLLKNESGSSGYTAVSAASSSTSATDSVSVHLHDWVNTRYIVEACNQSGCSESAPVHTTSAMLGAIGALRAADPAINDYLGYSVAMSGDGQYLAVSATNRDQPPICSDATCVSGENAGAVFVFALTDGKWMQQAEVNVNGKKNEYFGYSLALSTNGETLAVGTPFESSAAQGINGEREDVSQPEAGAVFVFSRSGTAWTEQAYIKASNSEAYDYFGGALQLSGDGNTLVVGAQGEASKAKGVDGDQADNSIGVAGAVYVFERNAGVWAQEAYIKASTQAYLNNDCFNPSPIRCLPTQGGRFGSSVALADDGLTLAVGAFHEHSNATGINGMEASFDARRSGASYVFVNTANGWQQQAYIKASNSRELINFGHKVSLSSNGNVLAVSSIEESSHAVGINGDGTDTSAPDSGAVYVFSRNGTEWQQMAYVKASNARASAEFGSSLALSADGEWLAVGAAKEKGGSAGINGDQSSESTAGAGAVYLFHNSGGEWVQHRFIKAPAPTVDDNFGFSLAMDDAGETLAIGALGAAAPIQGNNLAANAGAVFIY